MLEQIFTDRKKLIWRTHVELDSLYSLTECISLLKSSNGKKVGSLKLSIKIDDLESDDDNNNHFVVDNWYGNAKAYAIGTIIPAQQGTLVQFNVGIAQVDLLIYAALFPVVFVLSYKNTYPFISYLIFFAIACLLLSIVIWYAYAYVKSELQISLTKLFST